MIKGRNTLTVVVGVLSVAGVLFTIRFMFTGGENEGFSEYPTITNLHVLPGLIYLALAPVQFLSSVREKYPRYHRLIGRLLAVIGVVLGSTAMFISLVFPYSGLAEQIIVTGFGVFFVVSIAKGVQCARARQFARHREWMMRAFSIGLSIVTMRLIFIPMLIATGGPTRDDAELFSIVSFAIAFLIHAIGAELWIRYTRPN